MCLFLIAYVINCAIKSRRQQATYFRAQIYNVGAFMSRTNLLTGYVINFKLEILYLSANNRKIKKMITSLRSQNTEGISIVDNK